MAKPRTVKPKLPSIGAILVMADRHKKLLPPKIITQDLSIEGLIKTWKIFSLDIETPKLHAFSNVKPLVLVIRVYNQTFWWDLRKEVLQFLAAYCADPTIVTIIHNSIFDCPWLAWHYKWEFRNIYDTKLAEDVILGIGEPPDYINQNDESYKKDFSVSLGYVLARYKLAKISKELQTSFVGMTAEPFTPEQIKYFCNDVVYLEPLMKKQLAIAKKLDLLKVIELENQVAEVTYRMKVTGLGFDKSVWLDLAAKNEKVLNKLMGELNKMTHNKVANWNSAPQIKAYFATKGITIASLTDLADDDKINVARAYRGKSKALDLLVKIRTEAYKYVNTYGEPWLTVKWGPRKNDERSPAIGPDGRIHAEIRQVVSTGRMSMSKPNLQQLPNNIEGNPNHTHRKAFIPTPGYRLVSKDFKGQELGIMAAGAKYKAWIDAIRRGEDVHSIEASKVFSEWKGATKKGCRFPFKCSCPGHVVLRERAKKVNFGMPYGKTDKGLAPELGISNYEAKTIITNWHKENKELSAWLRHNAATAEDTYTIRTFPRFNRRRSLILETEEWRRRNQGMNTPVQGTGGDMIKYAGWLVWQFLEANPVWKKRVNLLLFVHDQIMTECKTAYVDQWAKILTEISERAAAEVLGIEGLVKAEIEIMDYWKPKN
jgi:DNA polymerase I-like protein with 3'-5' exonuclease and polymerase domains